MNAARVLLVAGALLATAGCVPNVRPDSYGVGSVGQVNRSVRATVISARVVKVDGTRGGGAAAGGAAGALAGSYAGGSDRANLIGAVGGLVIGSIAGAAAERSVSQHEAIEYVVETANGNLLTIVQSSEDPHALGAPVLVLYGSPSRLIADNSPIGSPSQP